MTKKVAKSFSWGLQGVDPHSVDPCNVRGKAFKVIKGDENQQKEQQSAVIDAQIQKRVAVLRIEMKYQTIRNFDDLTKQRAKTVTVGGKRGTRSATQPPQSMFLSSQPLELEEPEVKNKNAFELAMEKAEKNRQSFIERIRLS